MLKVSDIKKDYGKKKVLINVSFSVDSGQILSVYGPNGSGKTTLFHIISGVLKADNGSVFYDDINLLKNNKTCRDLIGFVPQDIALFNELSVKDNLIALSPLSRKERNARNKELLETLNLHEIWNKKIIELSGGMKRRVNLAAALLGNPRILILDEPFTGIDKENRDIIINYLHGLKNLGLTILVSSHSKHILASLSENILSLEAGTINYYGSISDFFI